MHAFLHKKFFGFRSKPLSVNEAVLSEIVNNNNLSGL
jgi:hypothetical protein